MLEIASEGLFLAGCQSRRDGETHAVVVGQDKHEWFRMCTLDDVSPYCLPGVTPCVTSNRVSFTLGLRGLSMTVDTACSSALVALNVAIDALKQKDCSHAMAAGVNILLGHVMFVLCSRAGTISPRGRCRTFDESADGYGRGEGAGATVVERDSLAALSDALESEQLRSRVSILGTAVNQDGRSASLTAPNGAAQKELLLAAWTSAQVATRHAQRFDLHGTGTALGDPIEFNALKNFLKTGADNSELPVACNVPTLGSVKANLSHLEGAAGTTGLLKCVLMLLRDAVPATPHLRQLNPLIHQEIFAVHFASEMAMIDTENGLGERRHCGVSGFGHGGTNAHVVLSAESSNAMLTQTVKQKSAGGPKFSRIHFPWLAASPRERIAYELAWVPLKLAQSDYPTEHERPLLLVAKASVQSQLQRQLQESKVLQTTTCTIDEYDARLTNSITQRCPDVLTVLLSSGGELEINSAATSIDFLVDLLTVVQAILRNRRDDSRLVVLTSGVPAAEESKLGTGGMRAAAVWGFMRSARLEMMWCEMICIDISTSPPEAVVAELDRIASRPVRFDVAELELTLQQHGERNAPRIVRSTSLICPVASSFARRTRGLVTGGLGGLGMVAAQAMAEKSAASIVLASRSGRLAPSRDLEWRLKLLQSTSTQTTLAKCDVSAAVHLENLLRLEGFAEPSDDHHEVVHAAGLPPDATLAYQTADALRSAMGPKAFASHYLHDILAPHHNAHITVFSSIAASVGVLKGVGYAAANAYADALVRWRRACGLPATSIQWGFVGELGMAAHQRRNDVLSIGEVSSTLRVVLCNKQLPSVILVTSSKWEKVEEALEARLPILDELLPDRKPRNDTKQGSDALQEQSPTPAMTLARALDAVRAACKDVLASAPGDDAELMQAGLDSISMVELRNQLSYSVPHKSLPATLVFDCPTIRALAIRLSEDSQSLSHSAPTISPPTSDVLDREAICQGLACRFPCGAWQWASWGGLLMAAGDAHVEAPVGRWDFSDDIFQKLPSDTFAACRHGGFCEGLDMFDASFFGISSREVEYMDPHQQVML
jgi:3-oxoacyl-(acyl-carrier-protein) synthase/NADP-dependent 3-hydroxy acid dehydrogenase YdfG/aryl carrier-like protein